uniref:Uncharacterized protein n=1 Tax=Seriola dumerili TaxID=41447 RepID=A0A3B4TXH8_SERDU
AGLQACHKPQTDNLLLSQGLRSPPTLVQGLNWQPLSQKRSSLTFRHLLPETSTLHEIVCLITHTHTHTHTHSTQSPTIINSNNKHMVMVMERHE